MRKYPVRNLGLKIVSLALAILLWFTLSGQRRERVSERGYAIPLTVVNLPADMIIASPLPDSVDIRLKGTFTAMRAADPSKMEAVMDLGGATPGEQNYKLSAADINAPEDLEVVRLSPSTVRLRLERTATRRVKIVPRLSGAESDGVHVAVEPPTAKIWGPESLVLRTDAIPTDPIPVNGRPAEFTTTVTLAAEPGLRVLEPRGPVTVRVRRKNAA